MLSMEPAAEYSPKGKGRGIEQADVVLVDSAHEELSVPPPPRPKKNGPVQERPYFCYFVMTVCCALFIVEIGRNGWQIQPLSCPRSCNGAPCFTDGSPCESNMMVGPTAYVMQAMGAKDDIAIFDRGEWWRILACNWLHVGLIHLLFNMLAILALGFPLERMFGWWRIGLLYVLSGIFGTMVSVVLLPGVISLGASASVFGLLGAAWADCIVNFLARCTFRGSGFVGLLFLTVFNILFGLTPFVDNFMHLGGLVSGLIVGLVFFSKRHMDPRSQKRKYTCAQIAIIVIGSAGLAAIIAGCIVLGVSSDARDKFRECEFCEKLNCVEITLFTSAPWWSCCMPRNGEGTCSVDTNATYTTVFCNMSNVEPFSVQCPRSEPHCQVDVADTDSVTGVCSWACRGC